MKNEQKIRLRYFNSKDIALKVKWINDAEINKYLHYDLPLCEDRTLKWYQTIINNPSREDFVYEFVLDNGDKVPLGLIGLLNIDKKNKKAEFYIVNGEKDYWGKGLATEASKKFLRLMFLKHDLNKIYLYTEVDNVIAQKLFEKVGFKQEGLLKRDLLYMGSFVDRYLYSIFREEIINEK